MEHPEGEVVAEGDMIQGMITVVGMANMEVMIVEAVMTATMTIAMEVVVVVDMVVGMVVGMVVDMEMMDMAEVAEEATTAKVAQEVGLGGHVPVVVQVGQVEVDLVVAVALVAEAGVDAVVLLEDGVVEAEVMVAMVRRNASLVMMAVTKVRLVATRNPRGSILITIISMGSRTPSKSGVVTTTTATRVINSGTKTPGHNRDGEVLLYLLIGSHSTPPTRFMTN